MKKCEYDKNKVCTSLDCNKDCFDVDLKACEVDTIELEQNT